MIQPEPSSMSEPYRFKLRGPLNMSQTEALVQQFRALSERGVGRLVVDLTDVPFIDSRGLMALLTGHRLFGGRSENFRLVALHDQHKLLLEVTGFDEVFEIHRN